MVGFRRYGRSPRGLDRDVDKGSVEASVRAVLPNVVSGIALSVLLCGVCFVTAAKAQTELLLDNQTDEQTDEPASSPVDLRERLQRLQEGARSMIEPTAPANGPRFPSLGSAVFDAQLLGYLAYVETVGTPDVLIVGSSRSLQGIDPTELRDQLSAQGHGDLTVYNFSVNGATAQVVNFLISELLPGELPRVIVWGDGSRAFNDGRRDRTWDSLSGSAGYQSVRRGEKPAMTSATTSVTVEDDPERTDAAIVRSNVTLTVVESVEPAATMDGVAQVEAERLGLDWLGFAAVGNRFDPITYYAEFAKVQGRYDGAYSPFILSGSQSEALAQLAAFVEAQGSQLVFVNLPLSDSYLDSYRLYREGQFRDFIRAQGNRHGFAVIDLLTQWESQPELFADPSHINQYGAAAIAQQLSRNSILLSALDLYPVAEPTQSTQGSTEPL